jgi:hypothetical protein
MTLTDKQNIDFNRLLNKLKQSHEVYKVCNEEQKTRLLTASQFLISQLVEFGKNRVFYESLLIYGMEFLLAEYGDEEEKRFGAFKQELSESEARGVEKAGRMGLLAWKKEKGRLIPKIYEPHPTMDQVRAREEFLKHLT